MCNMNLTLAVDERTVEKAREAAQKFGKSLNTMIREYIDKLAGDRSGEERWAELEEMWAETSADRAAHPERYPTEAYKWNRADAYDDRRYKP